MSQLELTVVSTLYRSACFVEEYVSRMTAAALSITSDFEIVLVNDGSPDESLDIAIACAKRNARIRIIDLARNFGHHAAILTGLESAKGRRVFLIDSDLEEVPELLLQFWREIDRSKADVIYGVHEQKTGSAFRQITSGAFWTIFNLLSEVRTERNICHVRLMERVYLDALLSLQEKNIFLGGLYSWPGYRQLPIRIERNLRRSVSTYNFWRRLSLMTRSIVAFSTRPLHVIFATGVLIAGLSFGIALLTLMARLVMGTYMLSGFASIVISIWFLSGLTIMSLGIIGLYVAQIYIETKGRPRALIRSVYSFPSPDNELKDPENA